MLLWKFPTVIKYKNAKVIYLQHGENSNLMCILFPLALHANLIILLLSLFRGMDEVKVGSLNSHKIKRIDAYEAIIWFYLELLTFHKGGEFRFIYREKYIHNLKYIHILYMHIYIWYIFYVHVHFIHLFTYVYSTIG